MAKELQVAIINYSEHMRNREFPSCFTEKEFKAWCIAESESVAHTQPIRKFVCRDCTPEYQSNMHKQGRCVNHELNLKRYAER